MFCSVLLSYCIPLHLLAQLMILYVQRAMDTSTASRNEMKKDEEDVDSYRIRLYMT